MPSHICHRRLTAGLLLIAMGVSTPIEARDAAHDHGGAHTAAQAAAQDHGSGHPAGEAAAAHVHTRSPQFDDATALKISQAAIGRIPADYAFTDSQGRPVRLSDYRGKPLAVSMIYTSCYHVCPVITQHLHKVIAMAQKALGSDSFEVVTIGFDSPVDTPAAMRSFADRQGVALPEWRFLSADAATIEKLSQELGFIYFTSPRGFDHLSQVTLIDPQGKIYRQVYGDRFDMPLLIEPLKELVSGVQSHYPGFAGLANRIRLFCTVYDPASQTYRTDYSLFFGMFIGFMILAVAVWFVVRETRRRERPV